VSIRALGNSMHPLIPNGSIVTIVPLPGAPVIGDVVAAERGAGLVIHRVHRAEPAGRGITLMGDCNLKPDRPFAVTDILGRAERVVTPRGWVMRLDTVPARLAGRFLAPLMRVRAALKRRFF